ncbi:serine hydrolase [Thermoleptolyngbya sichuanensis A183]|uniref:Serine hydrolase n=2 Tax=Thermoleptolyngbya TaxID=2303528 RepID=A0A6M8B895_9CYAN|nr:serine hydrolase [Thermoleptolyngbya sichuanensis]QKD82372.1 serine hydrolase [Thermoleptolyngbya sichuanensis A183]
MVAIMKSVAQRGWWYALVAPISAVGVMAGAVLVHSYPALTPVLERPYKEGESLISEAKSLAELYELRNRLQQDIENQPPTLVSVATRANSVPTALLEKLQAVEIRIGVEESAKVSWEQAIRTANQAVELKQQPDQTEETIAKRYQLWKSATDSLREVSADSFVGEQAAKKLKEYEGILSVVAYEYDTARSGFLKAIADSTGMGSQVHVTVCSLERECRRYQGKEPPASPASLIKVPLAIATMDKLTREKIDPDTPIFIDPSNYTEDAAKIWVGTEYPIRKVLLQTITHSSNIATNQLIDYVGWDAINQTLRDRGYQYTRISTKLTGNSISPTDNVGGVPNEINMDELTDMMVSIYNNEVPGADLILEGLVNQYDWELGYEAIRRPAVWIGEKTGQNSSVLGTTVGVNIKGKRYVISVAINYTASEPAVKQVISGIVKHLIDHNGF